MIDNHFHPDGSMSWYPTAWAQQRWLTTSFGEEPTLYVPVELLESAISLLKRARHFTPGELLGGHSLTGEINAFLKTFGIDPDGSATDRERSVKNFSQKVPRAHKLRASKRQSP